MDVKITRTVRLMVAAGAAVMLSCAAGCEHEQGKAAAESVGTDRGSVATNDAAAPSRLSLELDDALVIGASVSAGYEVYLPEVPPERNGGTTLAVVLGVICGDEPPRSLANFLFFMNRKTIAEQQLAAALELKPRIVFALDYLFWHAYGAGLTEAQRGEVLERGLARLESLDPGTAIVVADLPDMSHAIGKILSAREVPALETQESLNRRLLEWAASRPNVVVVPLRETVATAMAGGRVELGGAVYEGDAARGLLTENGLHATERGLIALALESLERLRRAGVLEEGVVWEEDAAAIRRALIERLGGGAEATSEGE